MILDIASSTCLASTAISKTWDRAFILEKKWRHPPKNESTKIFARLSDVCKKFVKNMWAGKGRITWLVIVVINQLDHACCAYDYG